MPAPNLARHLETVPWSVSPQTISLLGIVLDLRICVPQTTPLIIALILKTTIIFAAHEKTDFCTDPLRTPQIPATF
jgi:hypothetical protein